MQIETQVDLERMRTTHGVAEKRRPPYEEPHESRRKGSGRDVVADLIDRNQDDRPIVKIEKKD